MLRRPHTSSGTKKHKKTTSFISVASPYSFVYDYVERNITDIFAQIS